MHILSHSIFIYTIYNHWIICVHVWQIQDKLKFFTTLFFSAKQFLLPWLQCRLCLQVTFEDRIARVLHYFVNIFADISLGKIMCWRVCKRFLKCYHHLGNGWHCPEKYFKGFPVLNSRNNSFLFYYFIFRGFMFLFCKTFNTSAALEALFHRRSLDLN